MSKQITVSDKLCELYKSLEDSFNNDPVLKASLNGKSLNPEDLFAS